MSAKDVSAQDVIAAQIVGQVLGSGWDVAATRDQADSMARRAVKALETRGYAVVKLPKPVQNRRGEIEWHSGLAKIGLNQHGVFWTGMFQPTPSDVEEFAAALLAAERHRVTEAVGQ